MILSHTPWAQQALRLPAWSFSDVDPGNNVWLPGGADKAFWAAIASCLLRLTFPLCLCCFPTPTPGTRQQIADKLGSSLFFPTFQVQGTIDLFPLISLIIFITITVP